jgi:polar amino acid transport system substrate-binding protein
MHGRKTQSSADPRIGDLVQAGQIRIGVFPSFQYSTNSVTGERRGLALAIAHSLSACLGVGKVVTVEYATPPDLIEGLKSDGCDLGFMLIDPARATEVDFTPAFVRSDFTYLLPPGSQLRRAAEVDRPETRIAAVPRHASTGALERIIRQASVLYADSYESAVDLLRSGNAEAFASIREIALQYSTQLPNSCVMDEGYQSNFAGIAIAKGHFGRLSYITEFLDDLKRSGAMQRMIEAVDSRGIEVVLPDAR